MVAFARRHRSPWELDNGPVPDDHRVQSCLDERSCVRVEHLSLVQRKTSKPRRASRGQGSVQRLGRDRWKVVCDAGRDGGGKRRRTSRTVVGTRADANRALAALQAKVDKGEIVAVDRTTAMTVSDLMAWYLAFAREVRGLERTTLHGYGEVYEIWFKPQIGSVIADRLTPAEIDNVFGAMRAAGKSRSRMNNARSALAGAYKWGRCPST